MFLQNKKKRPVVSFDSPDVKENDPLLRDVKLFSDKYGRSYIDTVLTGGWTNPGHMFDELGRIFERNRNIFILGETADIARLTRKLEFLQLTIDSFSISASRLLEEPSVLNELSKFSGKGYTAIVAYSDKNLADKVTEQFLRLGRHFFNVNIFHEIDFSGIAPRTGDYLGVFAVYTIGKVYLKHNNLLVTTVCNLNCEYCLNYNPYNKHPAHFNLEALKNCIDIYFSRVDRVGFFELTGGEPMLFPYLQELFTYISNTYRYKIDDLNFVTNASVIPDDEFCAFLKHHNITAIIDDYSEAIPDIKENLVKTIETFQKNGTNVIIYPRVREFLQSFPPLRGSASDDKQGLQEKYRKCFIGVQNLRDGRLCSCTYMAFAVNAGLLPDNADDWFDIASMGTTDNDRKQLIEFRAGFNKKGYVDFCKYCNGLQTINNHTAPAAIQARGKLTWDINNPTYLEDIK
jgi:hypothetical protein